MQTKLAWLARFLLWQPLQYCGACRRLRWAGFGGKHWCRGLLCERHGQELLDRYVKRMGKRMMDRIEREIFYGG